MTTLSTLSTSHVDAFLSRVAPYSVRGNGWKACCPAHKDTTPSLDIDIGENGAIILQCRSVGCSTADILRSLHLKMSDLYPQETSNAEGRKNGDASHDVDDKAPSGGQRETGRWEYRDEFGSLLYVTVRLEPGKNGRSKDYRQKRPIGWKMDLSAPDKKAPSDWVWNLKDVRLIPWRYQELHAAAKAGTTIPLFIVEGEKCAESLVKLGLDATTNPLGAGKFGRMDSAAINAAFSGRAVVILPDNDEPGRKHADDVTRRLSGIAASIVRINLPGLPIKGDVADWLKAGGDAAKLIGYITEAPTVSDSPTAIVGHADDMPEGNESVDDPHRLARVFLEKYARKDGLTLRFYRGEFWNWSDGSYSQRVKSSDLQQDITQDIKTEFDKSHAEDVANWTGKGKPPEVKHVTRSVVSNAMQAISSIAGKQIPISSNMPLWIGESCPFPDLENVIATRSHLIYLPWFLQEMDEAVVPATPRFFSSACSPFDFNAYAEKPVEWLKFLDSVWPGDQQSVDLLQEWFGYLLTPDVSRQKMLLVVGPPRSGKGTIQTVLTKIVGEANVLSSNLHAMTESFGFENWIGKTVAMIPDCRVSSQSDSAIITEKLLNISGGDPVYVNRKGLPALTLKLRARLLWFTNELPRLHDASHALASRFCVLRMRETFLGREDLTLTKRLLKELPGILLWSMLGWERLNKQSQFTSPNSSQSLSDELRELVSPVGVFVSECCEVGENYAVSSPDLYECWKKWCMDNGYQAGSSVLFGKQLRSVIPFLERTRSAIAPNGQRPWQYRGIRIIGNLGTDFS